MNFVFAFFEVLFVFALDISQFFFDGFISVLTPVSLFGDFSGISLQRKIGLCVVGSSLLLSPQAIEFHFMDLVQGF